MLDTLANDLYAKGLIESTYAELPFSDRLIRIYEESGTVHPQYFDFSLPQNGVTKETPFWAGPAVFNMIRNPRLLDAIESLIGPEIYSNPVQHIRIRRRIDQFRQVEGPRGRAGGRHPLASGPGGDHRGGR